ncbi:hypothetical protein [Brevundimonas subvibrioides]|uniref:Uncharacterized protein n=1 Tax=Brevundimonas subvibrioides (strain ATCC 15264 / DSM 4735 / LMG 14903 / NBRC 16000 / CB 81) TaxID=633149 RepID=D9QJW7_BRESC|nr:hypothetical protein [Brevundimonas subvibrioides]ADK99718.1 hypothetical protein Bresu_0404 [Brevundimonas subvibrioides ATCC 15264]
MDRVTKGFGAFHRLRLTRFILAAAAVWVSVWVGIWACASHRTAVIDRSISAERTSALTLISSLAPPTIDPLNASKRVRLTTIGNRIDRDLVRRDATHRWADRAQGWGPLGLALILSLILPAVWLRGRSGRREWFRHP